MCFLVYFTPELIVTVSSLLFLAYNIKSAHFIVRFKHERLRMLCKIPDAIIMISPVKLSIPRIMSGHQHFRSRQYAYLAKLKAEEEKKKKFRQLTFDMF